MNRFRAATDRQKLVLQLYSDATVRRGRRERAPAKVRPLAVNFGRNDLPQRCVIFTFGRLWVVAG
jgi:hypothetical protein